MSASQYRCKKCDAAFWFKHRAKSIKMIMKTGKTQSEASALMPLCNNCAADEYFIPSVRKYYEENIKEMISLWIKSRNYIGEMSINSNGPQSITVTIRDVSENFPTHRRMAKSIINRTLDEMSGINSYYGVSGIECSPTTEEVQRAIKLCGIPSKEIAVKMNIPESTLSSMITGRCSFSFEKRCECMRIIGYKVEVTITKLCSQ